LRAELHDLRGEREQAITEYAHALRLRPNDIQLVAPLARLYGDDQSEKVMALYDGALPRLVEAGESKTGADLILGEAAFDFAMFYDERGDAVKCWQTFEIAMENSVDRDLAARIKRMSGRFTTIRGRSAFKALTGDLPETEQRGESQAE
jgi:cytochrome c-type biogenesis protein CcmH/NrfG